MSSTAETTERLSPQEQLKTAECSRLLEALGLIGNVSAGIQVDINAATKTLPDGTCTDAPLCDHNCRTMTDGQVTGHYDCPAAHSLHPELRTRSLAPMELIVEGIERSASGVRRFNQQFIADGFDEYVEKFRIPKTVKPILERALSQQRAEVNLFGGNPELHPSITDAITTLKQKGYVVSLTTTGGRFMRDPEFVERILRNPPNVVAVSADDFDTPDDIDALGRTSLKKIKELHDKTPFLYGQKRKTYEAAYVAILSNLYPKFPRVLFNLVIHPGNIGSIEEIIGSLGRNFPTSIMNPYPVQSAFFQGESTFTPNHLSAMERCVDARISEHLSGHNPLVPRLHYWLMLKAACITYADDPAQISRCLSGYDTWKCYEHVGAGRYLQSGASLEIVTQPRIAGGHLGCYWNPATITSRETQTWDMEPTAVSAFLTSGMLEIARRSPSPCGGCNFPRLNFDMISTELGMEESLIPAYLELRKQYVGF